MALVVQKYGGSSVADMNKMENVARRVLKSKEAGDDIVVVLSAMAGETDRLIQLAHTAADMPDEREYDALVSTGEQLTVTLLSIILNRLGLRAKSLLGYQVKIITDRSYTKARIVNIDTKKICKELKRGTIVVVAGFPRCR